MNAIPPGSTAPALGATAARTTLDVIADRTQRRRDLSTVGTPITAAFIGLLLAQRPAWAEQAAEATEGDGIEPIGSSEAAARTAAAGTVVGLAEGTDPMVRSASPSGSPVTTTSAPGDDSWIEIAVPIDGTISATSGLDISPPVPPGSGDLTFYMTAMENEFGDFFVDGQAELDIDYGDPLNPFGVYLSGSGLIIGTPYDDVLIGADTDDTIYGLAGDDFIDGRGGNDVVFAGSGNDQVFGGTGNDYLDLGSGNDRGFGQEGDDTIVVGTGNDTADGGSGDDVLVGGPANDLGVNNLYGGFGSDTYFVNAIGDIPDESFVIDDLASNSVVFGSEFDNLTGGRLPFFLSNDSFDLASGLSSSQYYFVNISSGIQNFAIGGEYGAVLYGSYDDNLLYGNAGNNTIFSVAGNNVIAGGGGSDYLYGGGGNDRYLLDVAGNGIDVIQDSGGRNSLVVDGVGMAALGFVHDPLGQTLTVSVNGTDRAVLTGYDPSAPAFHVETLDGATRIPGSNTAPTVGVDLVDHALTTDGAWLFTIPAGTFADTDPGETLTYTATQADGSALPRWLAFDVTTGTFAGTPGFGDTGAIGVLVTATDSQGAQAVADFVLTVVDDNTAPVAGVALPWAVVEDASGASLDVAGMFVDADGDGLTFAATLANGAPLPAWLSFDTQSGQIWAAPTRGDLAPVEVVVTATDGRGGVSSTTVGVSVVPQNDAPSVGEAVTPAAAIQGQAFWWQLPSDSFVDEDGNPLTLSSEGRPDWLQFDAATGTFYGTPSNADVASGIAVTVNASDGVATASTTLQFSVLGINDAPVVGAPMPNQTVTEGQPLDALQLPAGLFTDPDGDALTVTATRADGTALPAWLSFDGTTFNGTPTAADIGQVLVRLTATDPEGASTSATFNLTVANVNDAPVPTKAYDDVRVAEGETTVIALPIAGHFVDPDGDPLALGVVQADGSPLPSWLTFDPVTNTLSAAPTLAATAFGGVDLQVRATDGALISEQTTFRLDIDPLPALLQTVEGPTVREDGTVDIQLGGRFAEAPGASLTLLAAPDFLTFDATTGTFGGTPGNDDVGSYLVSVRARDAYGYEQTEAFTLEVTNTNDAPSLQGAIADTAVTAGESREVAVPDGLFADADLVHGDQLTWSARLADGSELPDWIVFRQPRGDDPASFALDPGRAQIGSHELQVTVTDTSGASSSTTFAVEVGDSNTPPVLVAPLPDAVVGAGEPFAFDVPADSFADDADDSVTLTASLAGGGPLPDWLSFDPATGRFSGTPDQAGTFDVEVTATDDYGAKVSDRFDLTVEATADPDPLQISPSGALPPGLPLDTFFQRPAYGDGLFVEEPGLAGQRPDGWPSWGDAGVVAPQSDNVLLQGTGKAAVNLGDADNIIIGNAGDNILVGGGGDDIIYGGGGNDELHGGSGNDRYELGGLQDPGFDTLYDVDGANVLDFDGVTTAELSFGMDGADVVIAVNGVDRALVDDPFGGGGTFEVQTDDAARPLAELVNEQLAAEGLVAAAAIPAADEPVDDVLGSYLPSPQAAARAVPDALSGFENAVEAPLAAAEPAGATALGEPTYLGPDGLAGSAEAGAAGLASKALDPDDPTYA